MSAVLTQGAQFEQARARIARWRVGGPALFAVEALGVPEQWDAAKREGVLTWQWKASDLLVKKRRLSIRTDASCDQEGQVAPVSVSSRVVAL